MSTIHEMKLQPKFFDFIKYGTKRIELRLYDEKRRNIELGDKIVFRKEPELKEVVEATVVGLLRYKSFKELFEDFDMSLLADRSMTKGELLEVLEEFYTVEKQEEFGVLGIKVEL